MSFGKSSADAVERRRRIQKISSSVDRRLQEVEEREDKELFIYSIREDIVQRTTDHIYRRDLNRQCVTYTIECARAALVRILETEFCIHDRGQPFYSCHRLWSPDEETRPSHPDSWAANRVSVATRTAAKPRTDDDNDDVKRGWSSEKKVSTVAGSGDVGILNVLFEMEEESLQSSRL